jgi:antitoxin ParD1/3/4
MPICEIDLTERHERFIEALISAGSFADASEVVMAGLRLLERRDAEDQARINSLRSGADAGAFQGE